AILTGKFPEGAEATAMKLTELVKSHGYSLSAEAPGDSRKWSDFSYAIPIAGAIIVGFVLLQKLGLVNLINSSEVGLGTAALIGLIASVSTCLAVVGGLVLSISANYAKTGRSTRPQFIFHIGRLLSFFVLGGMLGALGNSLSLGQTGTLILGTLVALVMLVLGVNLLDVFPVARRFQISLPKSWSKIARLELAPANVFVPFLAGAATFFLPCGFTQAMQIYSLSTGSFVRGGLTMLVFALGTLPMLALLSFGSVNINNKSWRGIFFKSAGILIIALAVFNLLNSFVVAGVINPIFNF
ncbi:MAG: sulfite exporter TauE/SafE family protein, partial [Candidatus Liptonbacteria bacterium]